MTPEERFTECKKANGLPLYKKDKKELCCNYRPFSILPVISKIIERIVFTIVYDLFLMII